MSFLYLYFFLLNFGIVLHHFSPTFFYFLPGNISSLFPFFILHHTLQCLHFSCVLAVSLVPVKTKLLAHWEITLGSLWNHSCPLCSLWSLALVLLITLQLLSDRSSQAQPGTGRLNQGSTTSVLHSDWCSNLWLDWNERFAEWSVQVLPRALKWIASEFNATVNFFLIAVVELR